MKKENPNLEYKGDATRSYLKTVSALANYRTGKIIFGITDDYKINPIADTKAFCENIENQINDSIKPTPDFSLQVNDDKTITLTVYQGENTPYLYHGKAYKRGDTASIEVDDFELRRLILRGKHLDFEETPCPEQALTFNYLSSALKERLQLEQFNQDTLKTLNLYSEKHGYNVAGGLLADHNSFPGLDIAVFGANENIIRERVDLGHQSVLKQYDEAIKVFERNYVYEEIAGALRTRKESIPEEAFREAVANSLVHRVWDSKANTKISMYNDHIEISSPGGLPSDISVEQYLSGSFSSLRNPILANVFHRLGIIEAFATGIRRIKSEYESGFSKPEFSIRDLSVTVILPLLKSMPDLSDDESSLLSIMKENVLYTRSDLEKASGVSKYSLIRTLNSLINKGIIAKEGKSSATAYRRIK